MKHGRVDIFDCGCQKMNRATKQKAIWIVLGLSFVVIGVLGYFLLPYGLKVSVTTVPLDEKTVKNIYFYNHITDDIIQDNDVMLLKVSFSNFTNKPISMANNKYLATVTGVGIYEKQVVPASLLYSNPDDLTVPNKLDFTPIEAKQKLVQYIPFWVPKGAVLDKLQINDHITYIYHPLICKPRRELTKSKFGLKISVRFFEPENKIMEAICALNHIKPEDLKENRIILTKLKFTNQTRFERDIDSFEYLMILYNLESGINFVTPRTREIRLNGDIGFPSMFQSYKLQLGKTYECYMAFWVPKNSKILSFSIIKMDYPFRGEYKFKVLN